MVCLLCILVQLVSVQALVQQAEETNSNFAFTFSRHEITNLT